MQKRSLYIFGAILSLVFWQTASGQFVAFNDHFSGPGTHVNATAWNVFGTESSAPGNSGPLKDIATGLNLPVTLTIINSGAAGGASAGGPAVGTPAYNTFNGFIDWGTATINHSILVEAADTVSHVFTGLDPAKRYIFKGTAVRAGGYTLRWTTFELADAVSFTPNHTANALTSLQYPNIAANQVVINTGKNEAQTEGDMAVWENIDPGPDGSFTVLSKQYLGQTPNGQAGEVYCYGLAALRLEEYIAVPTPVTFSAHPQNLTVNEFEAATFNIRASGNPSPMLQWYRVTGDQTNEIPRATNTSYTLTSASANDTGAKFFAVAQNTVSNVLYVTNSSVATLTVIPDTNAPVLQAAYAASSMTNVMILFSEPVTLLTATNLANYELSNADSGEWVLIKRAVLQAGGSNVVLTTAALSNGFTYNLVVSGICDRSVAANVMPANILSFTAQATFTLASVGGTNAPGTWTPSGNGGDLSGIGSDIGLASASDAFQFAYQTRSGDFDIQVRLLGFSLSDPWAKAGLMARAMPLTSNGVYAATLATPGMNGCFFQARATTGVNAAPAGSFPINYPYTYLRLQRSNTLFTSYAGVDGSTWMMLGQRAITMGDPVAIGFAMTSHSTSNVTTVQFRDFGDATGSEPVRLSTEPLGPSSRKTALVISEIMYHPGQISAYLAPSNSLEYVEIYNSQPFSEDISGYRLSGSIHYTFPPNTVMQAGSFLVVARDPDSVKSHYGLSTVLGPWFTDANAELGTNYANNGLPGDSGTVRLRNRQGAVMLDINYLTKDPWPVAADGTGHSLVLARPSYGEADPRAWAASGKIGGSPGRNDSVYFDRLRNVVINEFLANTSNTELEDFVELYNHGNQPLNLSGAWLSDDATTNRFRIPDGTTIGATSFVAFARSVLGFGLDGNGGRIYLVNSNADQVLDAVRYEGQARGVSIGRWPDGAPSFRELTARTMGAPNAPWLLRDIVINEIMYAPISGRSDDEYIELYNKGTNAVNMFGWKFTDGIDYKITNNISIPANGYLVVAKNKALLKGNYNNLNDGNMVGDYSGTLANAGERIALEMPEWSFTTNGTVITTNVTYFIENEVTYSDGGRWGNWSDGGGSSLELIDPRSDNRQPANWADSDETQKAPWRTIEWTGPIGELLSFTCDNVHLNLQGIGECLVDDVQVISGGNNVVLNGSFEQGLTNWVLHGSHDQSTVEAGGPAGYGNQCLHLRAGSRGDNGGNKVMSAPNWGAISGNVTLHAQVRWLKGWPEFLMRLHAGGAEAYGPLAVPNNLGTPGAPNSRAVTNAGPAIWDVKHAPICPADNEPVQVMVRAFDPDGISALALRYRVDPAEAYSSTPLVDDGSGADAVAGDGIYTGTIPAQGNGTIVAFYIEARDAFNVTNLFPQDVFPTAPLVRTFPNDAPLRECVVRWGEIQMPGSLGTYHLWLTTTNLLRWRNRDHLNNSTMDGTFVYNNCRIIYNSMPNFGGSPWHRGQMDDGPAGTKAVDYVQNHPADDRFLGATDSTLCNPGNPGGGGTSDLSAQSEQSSYIIFNAIGLTYNYRRYIHFFVNGSQRSKCGRTGNFVLEDAQQPNGDMVNEWYPDDTDGELFKIEDWFEFNDNGFDFTGNNDADVTRRTIQIAGQPTLYIAPYRYMFRRRAYGAGDSVNDYANFFKIVDAASPASNPSAATIPNPEALDAIINAEQWLRVFACQHTVGNWDSYGWERGKNDYMYKPINGRFEQMTWDIDFTMGIDGRDINSAIDVGVSDARMAALMHTPVFSRAYLRAFEDIVNGPLKNSFLDPILDEKQAALLANNIDIDTTFVGRVKTYATGRRDYLLSVITNATLAPFSLFGPSSFETNGNWVTINGSAPVHIQTLKINGVDYPLTWSAGTLWTPTNWSVQLYLGVGINSFTIQGYDLQGNPVAGASTNVQVNYTGPGISPVGAVVFNEIMYNPTNPSAEYVEILNTSSNYMFDISGWRINGLGNYVFPGGTILTNRQLLILARDRAGFATAYGSSIPVFGEYDGNLDANGETLTLIKPAVTPTSTDITIDKVRYEAGPPWPVVTPGTSIQLIDGGQDNARAGNWAGGAQWRFFSATGNPGTNTALYIYPTVSGCDVFVDEIRLVMGTNALEGTNLLANADFENGTNGWVIKTGGGGGSCVTNLISHNGSYSMHLISALGGNPSSYGFNQMMPTNGFTPNTNYTLSYWYLSNFKGSNLLHQMGISQRRFLTTNSSIAGVPYTPKVANSVAATVPEFPPIWLNEVQAKNVRTRTNRFGEFAPWVELHNPTTNTVELTGLFLANNYSNMYQWAFPTGTVIAGGDFKIVWLDGAASNSIPTELHANFTIPELSGSVVLARMFNSLPQAVDYLNYSGLGASLSYGDFPDGQPFSRQVFINVTPGGTNDSQHGSLFINEWVASNVQMGTNGIAGIPNPVGGGYDDWFELYNPNPYPVNLNDYYLTDTATNPTQYRIPNGYVVPANGFLVVWADGNPGRNRPTNSELHVNFNLGKDGEQIGIYDMHTNLIDLVTFLAQTNNISQGRYGDGAAEPFSFMPNPSPGAPNFIIQNFPPVFQSSIPDLVVTQRQTIIVTNVATDPNIPLQSLTYHLGPSAPVGSSINPATGVFTWHTLGNQAGAFVLTVWVEDNGLPRLSATNRFNVTVISTNTTVANTRPVVGSISDQHITVGEALSFTVSATDTDLPPQNLSFSLEPGMPAGANITPQGLFTWTPDAPTTNVITVRVTDDGTPPLSGTGSFTVTVVTPLQPGLLITRDGDQVQVSWPENATGYQLQYASDLGILPSSSWTNYTGATTTGGGRISTAFPLTTNQFFRLIKQP